MKQILFVVLFGLMILGCATQKVAVCTPKVMTKYVYYEGNLDEFRRAADKDYWILYLGSYESELIGNVHRPVIDLAKELDLPVYEMDMNYEGTAYQWVNEVITGLPAIIIFDGRKIETGDVIAGWSEADIRKFLNLSTGEQLSLGYE